MTATSPTAPIAKTRNGIIELLRFLFATWVVYYHGFFPIKTAYFDNGKIAVEFFFVLSGLFMLKTFEKQKGLSVAKGCLNIVGKLFKSLGIAFVIGTIFAVWYAFVDNFEGITYQFVIYGLPGYLWYVYRLAIVSIIFFVLYRLIKNKIAFLSIIFATFLACAHFLYLDIGILRALGAISLGILVAQIPQINFKSNKATLALKIIGALLSFVGCVVVASLPNKSLLTLLLLYIFGFSSLLYFANQLNVSCKFLSFLGCLSFGLYSYQCVLRIMEFYGLTNTTVLFLLLLTMTVVDKHKEFFALFAKSKPIADVIKQKP